jgi:tRNA pseudouridine synthase 10
VTERTLRIHLESRYRKFCRDLPQTIHWCPRCRGSRRHRVGCATCGGQGKLSPDSVQELIARRLLPAYRARAGKFHGAGREDLDVRMLGRGRPFVFEIVGPRRTEVDLGDVLRRINEQEVGRIAIDPFQVVERARIKVLKEGCYPKRYQVGVAVEGALDLGPLRALLDERLGIAQRTPSRVAHRRADLVRERWVVLRALRCGDEVGDLPLELEVETEHGTYVKEWVSGDEGRTAPSLADLLGRPARCARLDVLEILDEER